MYIHSPFDDPVSVGGISVGESFPIIDPSAGEGRTVGVVDTGLDEAGLEGALLAEFRINFQDRIAGASSDSAVGRTAGHGTFIASIIARVAPSATVLAYESPQQSIVDFHDELGTLVRARTTSEYFLANEILARFTGQDPLDVLSLSLGTFRCAFDGQEQPPPAADPVRAALLTLDQRYGSDDDNQLAIVAAAGNHGVSNRFYPAGYALDDPCFSSPPYDPCSGGYEPFLFAVGSTASENSGEFSNYGPPEDPWVSFYAQGGDAIGWKPLWDTGAAGWYFWSGTSFAAPCAAAQAVAQASSGTRPLDVLRASINRDRRSSEPASAADFRCDEAQPAGSSRPD
jgi:hypothetical protein